MSCFNFCCCFFSAPDRVLPKPQTDERAEFERLLQESIEPGNSNGWNIKTPFENDYNKSHFKMRISLKPDPNGNANNMLRADGKFKGVKPQQFMDYLLNPKNLPGLQEWKDVEGGGRGETTTVATAAEDTTPATTTERSTVTMIKYCKVKAPMMAARDHVWNYIIEKDKKIKSNTEGGTSDDGDGDGDGDGDDDGDIFVTIRTTSHSDYEAEPNSGIIRAYYYNSSKFSMSKESGEEDVMLMTEFIFQDLKGGLPVCLMNAALPAGTIAANKNEMKLMRGKTEYSIK